MPASDDRVNAVSRALSLLDAFDPGEPSLPLSELCRRSRLPKTSVLRLLRTLEDAGYLARTDGSQWRLGPAAARLAGCYEGSIDNAGAIRSTLASLAAATGRSATFFVHEGDARVLLLKVQQADGDVPLHVGQRRPLERGAAGKVILAGIGERGSAWDAIRRRGFDYTLGEVNTTIASLAAPVRTSRGVLGSVCISAPKASDRGRTLEVDAPAVMAAARWLSSTLINARAPSQVLRPRTATWHP